MPCEAIADEIQHGIDILSTNQRDIAQRHQSMRAVFDYSWQRLSSEEQVVFSKLAVFRAGFTAEAAQQVAGASLPTLTALIDKSLVQVLARGRYDLHELLRQYAEAQLELSGATEATLDGHCRYYASFLGDCEADLKSHQQMAALKAIDADLDNVRSAWYRAVRQGYEREIGQLINSFFLFCQMHSRQIEVVQMLEPLLRQLNGKDKALTGHLLLLQAMILQQNSNPESLGLFRQGISILRRYGFSEMDSMPLHILAYRALSPEDYAMLDKLYRDNLRQLEANSATWGMAWYHLSLGSLAFWAGNYDEARAQMHWSVETFAALGDRGAAGWAWDALGALGELSQAFEDARYAYQQAITIYREMDDWAGMAYSWGRLGAANLRLEDRSAARRCFHKSLRIMSATTLYVLSTNSALMYAAELLALGEHLTRAVELLAMLMKREGLWIAFLNQAQYRLDKLKAQLDSDTYINAIERGNRSDPVAVAEGLAEELKLLLQGGSQPGMSPLLVEALTPREMDVLALLAEGLSNAQIAQKLVISIGTVKGHTGNSYSKLNVNNRHQAALRAQALGILGSQPET